MVVPIAGQRTVVVRLQEFCKFFDKFNDEEYDAAAALTTLTLMQRSLIEM